MAALPAAGQILKTLAANPKVQEAAVDKGLEVVGKLVDKSMENINQAQENAAKFLKKEVSC